MKGLESKDTSYYLYLNELRRSGAVNMFQSGPYLVANFGIDRFDATDIVHKWMNWVTDNPKNLDL